ncbi:transcription factor iiib-like protein [Echria macrotheca]|uniref:Transcription factor iiib-like protein n=1 Tax=Echria macrotheca TaxID=438768 RepID=A0AAJ0BER8_9PEZI|nr:transcription factor iiib-like protein [Echria macrotheca]
MAPSIRVSAPAIRIGAATGGGVSKPKPKKVNAVRRIMEREESRERRVRESSAVLSSAPAQSGLATQAPKQCPNKTCKNPRVRDGVCQTCGAVAEENDIVAEVTFGEAANGAAIVQGNFVGADEGAVRSAGGYAFRRTAGGSNEAKERLLRDAKVLLQQWTHQLRISPSLAENGLRTYKAAIGVNFVQGRRTLNVTAICLYAVCRKEMTNKVMLIDLADIIKTDVFVLGRDYKALLSRFPDLKEGTKPIILEDLIFRFASKLEFYHDTNKVADSAVRIAARMRKDNMTHGRRPAGICGAAIIMAARAHNYRRTVREVVYIAKVTMATLQERMIEFANVPSAQMTISEFHEQDFLESNHDPPFVYKQTKEWKDKHTRPRKRKAQDINQDDQAEGAGQSAADGEPAAPASQPQPSPAPVIDKDGFVVPPLPQRVAEGASEQRPGPSVIATATGEDEEELEALASEYGDSQSEDEEVDPSSEMAMAAAQGVTPLPGQKSAGKGKAVANGESAKKRRKRVRKQLVIDEEWEMDEANLEKEVEGHLNDPEMIGASEAVTKDAQAQRAQEAAQAEATEAENASHEEASEPTGPISPISRLDDPIVHEDEFKDDPEVMYCVLGEEEVKIKEMIWANHNKDYMRQVQQKIFESKMSENGPPKQRRNRAKKPRIGEGQASPAQSAEEAAVNMMRTRSITTKLDYSRLGQVFDMSNRGPGSIYGGTNSNGTQSGVGSEAGSDAGDEAEGATENNGGSQTVVTEATTAPTSVPGPAAAQRKEAGKEAEQEDEDDYEGSDEEVQNYEDTYEQNYDEDTYMEESIDPFEDDCDNGYDEE